MPAVGALLGGKYRVIAKIGEGGMGTVFRAQNVVTGKHVALKWMHPHVAANSDAAGRLLREAQAASRLSHPNVVDVYDIVQDDKTIFLVMELLEGETLRAHLERNPHPKISEFISLLLPAMEGVAAAHDKGVIHRDLKPDNIFLVRSPVSFTLIAKVVDFGVAKVAESQGLTLTATGMSLGTPLYMSVEQLRGDKDVDVRADVYAFGVMLYQAITGELPYTATTLPELAIKVATTDAVPVKVLRPDVPTPLARVIDWAIARKREQRLPNVRALIQELEVFARDAGLRNQMTNPEAGLPRLASEDSRRASQREARRSPVNVPPTAVATIPLAARPLVVAGPVAADTPAVSDTLTARELASRQSGSWRRRPFWGAAAVVVICLVAVAMFVLRRDVRPAAAASSPLVNTVEPLPTAARVEPPQVPQPRPAPGAGPPSLPQNVAPPAPMATPAAMVSTPQSLPAHAAVAHAVRPLTVRDPRSPGAATAPRVRTPLVAAKTAAASHGDAPQPAHPRKSAAEVLGF